MGLILLADILVLNAGLWNRMRMIWNPVPPVSWPLGEYAHGEGRIARSPKTPITSVSRSIILDTFLS